MNNLARELLDLFYGTVCILDVYRDVKTWEKYFPSLNMLIPSLTRESLFRQVPVHYDVLLSHCITMPDTPSLPQVSQLMSGKVWSCIWTYMIGILWRLSAAD